MRSNTTHQGNTGGQGPLCSRSRATWRDPGDYRRRRPVSSSEASSGPDPQLIVNMWGYLDAATGLIYALGGRVYGASGSDAELTELLRSLAPTDYVTAKRHPVPSRFQVVLPDGNAKEGYVHPGDPWTEGAMAFQELFRALEDGLPKLPTFLGGGGHIARAQSLGSDPLFLWTILYEDEGGEIRPIISSEDRTWAEAEERRSGRLGGGF